MKLKLLTLLLLLLSLQLFAQNEEEYYPVLGETNEWYIVSWDYYRGAFTTKYFTTKDTTINNKVYKCIDKYSTTMGEYLHDMGRYGYIREDIDLKQLYFSKSTEPEVEFIIADFTLNEGDKFILEADTFLIDSIRIIETPVGQRHKWFTDKNVCDIINLQSNRLSMTEGIGLFPFPFGAEPSDFNNFGICYTSCYYKDGIKLQYFRVFNFAETEQDCIHYVGINKKEKQNKELKIAPNPVKSIFEVQFENPEMQKATINLLTLCGSVTKSYTVNSNTCQVDCSNMPEGIYIVQLEFENGERYYRKVVVKK